MSEWRLRKIGRIAITIFTRSRDGCTMASSTLGRCRRGDQLIHRFTVLLSNTSTFQLALNSLIGFFLAFSAA
jgi:hypothetical protein